MLATLLRRCTATKLIGSQLPVPLLTEFTPDSRDKKMTTGRAWRADELRLKADDDLHKLWYVLLREKSLLISDKQFKVQHRMNKGPQDRIIKVRISMARLLTVVHERHLVREAYKAALDKEYMEANFPSPQAKPNSPQNLHQDANALKADVCVSLQLLYLSNTIGVYLPLKKIKYIYYFVLCFPF